MKSGKVGVTVQTPVGKAVGVQTFKEIKAGIKPQPEDKPAVVTKPMLGGARTAAPPKPPVVASSDLSIVAGKADDSASVSMVKPNPKPKPASSDPQAKAKRLLKMGKNYLANGMTALAKKKFQEIVTKYPGTQAAAEAKKHLD